MKQKPSLGQRVRAFLDPATYSEGAVRGKIETGRESKDWFGTFLFPFSFLPRRTHRDVNYADLLESKNVSYAQLLDILPDIDPDVSMALWNILRLAGGDYTVSVTNYNSDVVNPKGQKFVDDLIERTNPNAGGMDSIISQLFMSIYLQGAVSAEAVISKQKTVIDLAPVNPYTILFRPEESEEIPGLLVPKPFQQQWNLGSKDKTASDGTVALNPLTFWYIPLDPQIGDPYGRPAAGAAISDVFFNMRVLYDLRNVIKNQGWPRIDVTVLTKSLIENAPAGIKSDPQKLRQWVNENVTDLSAQFKNLKADDTFTHTDAISIGSAELGHGRGSTQLLDPSPVLMALERRIIRGLKMLPLLMGSNEGTTETHGNLQVKVFAKGIESLQKPVENVIESYLNLALRLAGIPAQADVEFERVDINDRKAEADAEMVEIENAAAKRDQGWISQDEASNEITGSDSVGEPKATPSLADILAGTAGGGKLNGSDAPTGGKTAPEGQLNAFLVGFGYGKLQQRAAGKSAPISQTEYRKRETAIYNRYYRKLKSSFRGLGKMFPTDEIVAEIEKVWPRDNPDNSVQTNYLSTNDPIYNTTSAIVRQFFSRNEAQNILDGLNTTTASIIVAAFENRGNLVLSNLNRANPAFVYQQFRLNDEGLQRLINQRVSFFGQSSFETTADTITNKIVQGYRENKTVGEIAKDLRATFQDMSVNRSNLIATTELNWATSNGAYETMKRNKVQSKKWLTANDDKVRPEHMRNQEAGVIPINASFPSGDLAPPPAGSPYNCRCVLQEVTADWTPPGQTWSGGDQSPEVDTTPQ